MKSRRERLREQLTRQILFIEGSSRAYDAGMEPEAIRIATALRVLFHTGRGKSTSLMSHLGQANCTVLSSRLGEYRLGPWTAFVRIQIDLRSAKPIRPLPRLGSEFVPLPLLQWWNEVVHSYDSRQYSRKDLVLAAANKDGGAHVDLDCPVFYEDLEAGAKAFALNGANLQFNGVAPFEQSRTHYARDLHMAMLRQLGHEVRLSAIHSGWCN